MSEQLSLIAPRSYRIFGEAEWVRLVEDGPEVCRACRRPRTPEGHDPCSARLPGTWSACCGHGVEEPYLFVYRWRPPHLGTWVRLEGAAAATKMRELGGWPPPFTREVA